MVEYSLYEGTGWHWNTEKRSWRQGDPGDKGQGLGNEGDTTLRGEKGHGLRDGGKRQWDRGTKRGFKNVVLIPGKLSLSITIWPIKHTFSPFFFYTFLSTYAYMRKKHKNNKFIT